MKLIFNHLVIIFVVAFITSCKTENPPTSFATADFSYSLQSASSNTVHFIANVSGTYELLEWTFNNGSSVTDVKETDHYFPLKGSYVVSLTLWNKGEKVTTSKTVEILLDDPNYAGPALLWSDEFDGSALNSNFWVAETNIRFNNELQDYQASGNHTVSGGVLTITAKKVNDNKQYGSYTSARLVSKNKKEFKYGRMEIRAKLPKGKGTWPAIWMLGSNIDATSWPTCGEIDIMEYVGYNPGWVKGSIHCAAHFAGNSIGGDYAVTNEEDYHVYGINWTASKIEYYVDDKSKPYFTYNPDPKTVADWPFNQPFFFILNLAIGGDWGGAQGIDNAIFPAVMTVDYVRVFAQE